VISDRRTSENRPHVVFALQHFALRMQIARQRTYIKLSQRACPPATITAARMDFQFIQETPMNIFKRVRRVRRVRTTNLVTTLERQRLARTMPGQTGAVAAARYGCLV
jgi:hypothetical protein